MQSFRMTSKSVLFALHMFTWEISPTKAFVSINFFCVCCRCPSTRYPPPFSDVLVVVSGPIVRAPSLIVKWPVDDSHSTHRKCQLPSFRSQSVSSPCIEPLRITLTLGCVLMTSSSGWLGVAYDRAVPSLSCLVLIQNKIVIAVSSGMAVDMDTWDFLSSKEQLVVVNIWMYSKWNSILFRNIAWHSISGKIKHTIWSLSKLPLLQTINPYVCSDIFPCQRYHRLRCRVYLNSLLRRLRRLPFENSRASCYNLHCKSERSVLALKIGPFQWVKYSPIFESNLAPLNQGKYSPIS